MQEKKICMSENSQNGKLLRQELVSYLDTEIGFVRKTVERVFYADGKYVDSLSSTPITSVDEKG
jgi:hypothetical protein